MTQLDSTQVEQARLRVQQLTSDELDAGPGALCTALATVVPLLRQLRADLVQLGKDSTWLPGWLIGGLVGTIVDALVAGLDTWHADRCEPNEGK